jgi:hypothetical protein
MEWHWKESETTIAEAWAAIFDREAAQATDDAARDAAQDRAASARAHAQQQRQAPETEPPGAGGRVGRARDRAAARSAVRQARRGYINAPTAAEAETAGRRLDDANKTLDRVSGPGPGQGRGEAEQAPGLAAQLERGERSAQRLQAHRAERAAADDRQREHDQATGPQRSAEQAVAKEAPEAGR